MLREKSEQEVELRRLLTENKKEAARDLVVRLIEENTAFVFYGPSRDMIPVAGEPTFQTAVCIVLADGKKIDIDTLAFMTREEHEAVWLRIAQKFILLADHALFELRLPDAFVQKIASGMHLLEVWLAYPKQMMDLSNQVTTKLVISSFYFARNPLAETFGLSRRDFSRPTSTRHRLYNGFVDCLLSHGMAAGEIRQRVCACLEHGVGCFKTEHVFRLAGMKCFDEDDATLTAVLQKHFNHLWREVTRPRIADGSNELLLPFGYLARKRMIRESDIVPLHQLLAEMMSRGETRIVFEIAYLIGTDLGLYKLTDHADAAMGEQPGHHAEMAQDFVRSLVPVAFRLAQERKEYGNAAALVYEFRHEYCIPANERPSHQQAHQDTAHFDDLLKEVNRVCELAFLQGQRIPIHNCRWNYNPV